MSKKHASHDCHLQASWTFRTCVMTDLLSVFWRSCVDTQQVPERKQYCSQRCSVLPNTHDSKRKVGDPWESTRDIYQHIPPIYGLYNGCLGQYGIICWEQLLGVLSQGYPHFPFEWSWKRRGDVSMGPWTEDLPPEVQLSKSKLRTCDCFTSCGLVRSSSWDDGKIFCSCGQSFQEAWGLENWTQRNPTPPHPLVQVRATARVLGEWRDAFQLHSTGQSCWWSCPKSNFCCWCHCPRRGVQIEGTVESNLGCVGC